MSKSAIAQSSENINLKQPSRFKKFAKTSTTWMKYRLVSSKFYKFIFNCLKIAKSVLSSEVCALSNAMFPNRFLWPLRHCLTASSSAVSKTFDPAFCPTAKRLTLIENSQNRKKDVSVIIEFTF